MSINTAELDARTRTSNLPPVPGVNRAITAPLNGLTRRPAFATGRILRKMHSLRREPSEIAIKPSDPGLTALLQRLHPRLLPNSLTRLTTRSSERAQSTLNLSSAAPRSKD
ncbi:hypothetical protein NDU88_004157 [Pleurodeles waltl]|uniref:Uncharacterized protein n=1 Tax=Pleurodeles waltl TaxID=8319 RepID=A0AAV7V0L7_PLEWA|nr:hypothetical protein NDU88_004157 [Pleurodeles waltl]